ncbi:MAG TPA: hypothetical protein VFW44_01375 [Bryobacteraceae bacterium]|nr:hypothetical protein [Bryobacteraceae bacterium]
MAAIAMVAKQRLDVAGEVDAARGLRVERPAKEGDRERDGS